ncbi:hypothetical protein GAY33_09380 [Azospirillum brasilense]|uniref:hypothetical protein n=1 Tax=Azospirillum argentinense TaxID=2970906 RepID=UPI00190C766D|nr:hypothetical protein [Azospirillum argentinense]MBK3799435.1 hypothetical protein [Azospirillum argentinense]
MKKASQPIGLTGLHDGSSGELQPVQSHHPVRMLNRSPHIQIKSADQKPVLMGLIQLFFSGWHNY